MQTTACPAPLTVGSASRPTAGAAPLARRWVAAACLAVAAGPAAAFSYGPFTLSGFAKLDVTRGSNVCDDCQREAGENRHRVWADDIVYGKRYGTDTGHVFLFQPYLSYKQNLGRGFHLDALLSQRWRDGEYDIQGFVFERNVGIRHEDYGSLRVGAMPTRAWSMADYPHGSNVGVSDAWASSGAGYGLLSRAVRYQSRMLDVMDGDLVLEVTYDIGKSGWKKNKPRFLEIFAQYVKSGLVLEMMLQDTRNGEPVSWGKAPFGGLTAFPADDPKLGSSGQGIAMLMARYQYTSAIELYGGLRLNRWSGAYAVPTSTGPQGLWNNMFNVDWGGFRDGVPNPGYAARSTDVMAGLRYRFDERWAASTGMVFLSKASTKNPSERGQSNSALINTVGVSYNFLNGLEVSGSLGMVNYGRKGLAPMSMPAHRAFTNVDPRVAQRGNWFGVSATFTF